MQVSSIAPVVTTGEPGRTVVMKVLRIAALVLCAAALGLIGFDAIVAQPQYKAAMVRERAQWARSNSSASPYMSSFECAEVERERDRIDQEYARTLDRRDTLGIAATAAGILAFLLALVATHKRPKALLVFGALAALAGGLGWIALKISSDGHL